jgi:transposase
MESLRGWLKRHSERKLVEPHSDLGTAINTFRKHREKLALFLRVASAPLDDNICELALKKAILYRRNARSFKTPHCAAVGDLYRSLIHTCELKGGDPFDYLTAIQRRASEVATTLGDWMPWNHAERLLPGASE